MPHEFPRLLLSWVLLLLLGGLIFGLSFVPMNRSLRPLLMLVSFAMSATVAISFMEVGKGPVIVRGFAVASLFWLLLLLGLGSLDLITRADHFLPPQVHVP